MSKMLKGPPVKQPVEDSNHLNPYAAGGKATVWSLQNDAKNLKND